MSRKITLLAALMALALLAGACNLLPSGDTTASDAPPADEPATIPGQPAAPAAVDGDFRSDSASLVAATGNPQLIEFFAFW